MTSRAIILAAGKGSRLNGTAGESPKCLVQLGGMSLIERQVRVLRRAGIDDIAYVDGCKTDRLRPA
jgi:choline kinase